MSRLAQGTRGQRRLFTKAQALLNVASSFAGPFTKEDLAVRAFAAYPDLFGMKGYPHPDANRVNAELYGRRGLVAKGFLQRRADGRLVLSNGEG